MAYKQLGPGVSQNPQAVVSGGGAFTAEDHSWESLVFQHNQPVIDWELNLQNEICGPYGLAQHIRQTTASGFLSGDFYESGELGSSFTFPTVLVGSENSFEIAASDLVVNGWNIRFEYSGTSTSGQNKIDLPAPPISGTDTNVVILEVWRALVAPGSPTNKSLSGQILRHGNAKAPDTVGNRNLADDLIDPTYLQVTQARVQIQYRYRVVSSWDVDVLPEVPDGMTAHTTPYLGASDVDGGTTAYTYSRVDGDSGLWRAGAGDSTSATALGTVDGFIYAVPVCVVFRRNSASFDRGTNLNGGALIAAGTSDRPDGLFSDQVVASDVRDLRKGAASDFQEALTKNFEYLLQNTLSTQHEITVDATAGTSVFVRDELGVGNRQPDGVRMYFSDRATIEAVVCHVPLSTPPHVLAEIDITAMNVVWYGAVDVSALAPAGTIILGVNKVRIRIAATSEEVDGFDPANGKIHVNNITLTTTHVSMDLIEDIVISGAVHVYVELSIGYPKGCGLSRTPSSAIALWMPTASLSWIDAAYVTAVLDVSRKKLDSSLWSIDNPHRELRLVLKGETVSESIYASPTGDYVMLPMMLDGSAVSINDGINPPYVTTSYTPNQVYTRIALNFTVPANTVISISYAPIYPAPPLPATPDTFYEVFYQSKAVQSVAIPAGTYQMKLRARAVGSFVTILTAGSASPDDMLWPTMTGFSQIPMSDASVDSAADSSVGVLLPNSATNLVGFANVPVKVSHLQNGEVVLHNIGDTTQDPEGRHFWPRADQDNVGAIGAPDMASSVPCRTAFPVLMEVVSTDTDLVRPGTMVLAVFTMFQSVSNPAAMASTVPGNGCVALYRTRGNLMNPRRLTP